MVTFLALGHWRPDQVRTRTIESSRKKIPEVEQAIEIAWETALRRPGVKLFDGPMCRLERWDAAADRLELELSPTSYKVFLGTNLANPEFADRYGREVMASPVGVSPALQTADGYLLLGRRNDSVAYYPSRTHPFAGALEPRDQGDLFAAIRRELYEELGLGEADIAELSCTGIAEDHALHQPELLFWVRSTRSRQQIESQVLPDEHRDSVAIPARPDEIVKASQDPTMTPVAVASLLLWGRITFGEAWFQSSG